MRRLLRATVVALSAVAPGPPPAARGGEQAPDPPEAAEVLRPIAESAATVARSAAKGGNAPLARLAARRARTIAPDLDVTKEVEEILATGAAAPLPPAETAKLRVALRKAETTAALACHAVAVRIASRDADAANRLGDRALAIDPDQERIRKAAGFERFELAWVPALSRKSLDAAAKAKPVRASAAWERIAGAKLSAHATTHVRVEGSGRGSTGPLASQLEALRARAIARLGTDPADPSDTRSDAFFVPADERQWRAWVTEFAPKDPAAWFGAGGMDGASRAEFGVCAASAAQEPTLLGSLAHHLAHRVDEDLRRAPDADWIAEGLALDLAAQAGGRTGPCTNDEAGLADWRAMFGKLVSADAFDEAAARDAAAGRDPPLEKMLEVRLGTLTVREAVKATAIVRWWIRSEPWSFARVVGAVRRGAPFRKALADEAGMVPAELEAEWRAAVRRP